MPFSFTLLDPSRRRVTTGEFTSSPMLIYRFRNNDPEGVWTLFARRGEESATLSINFVKPKVRISSAQNVFSLSANHLNISGTVTLVDQPDFLTTVILARRGQSNLVVDVFTNITVGGSNLHVKVSQDVDRRLIRLSPYLTPSEEAGKGVTAIIWAELLIDVPLVKMVGPASSVTTFVKDVALRTQKARVILSTVANQTLDLSLQSSSTLVPLRDGKMEILLNVQVRDTIHLVRVPFLHIPTGNGLDIVGVQEFSPSRTISYSFIDDLLSSRSYDLLLISKVYGVDAVWNATITPPLARILLLSLIHI